MRKLSSLLLPVVLVLGACERATDITAPEMPDPLFHIVDGDPSQDDNNAYSMYFIDLNLRNDLILKLAQEHPDPEGTMEDFRCPGDPTTHNNLGEHPPFPGVENLHPARGLGTFADRSSWPWKRGSLLVRGACWFDEWNEAGFPESAWVWGTAVIGWRQYRTFIAMLKSGGFPDPSHLNPLQLDLAVLQVEGLTEMTLLGELHHENGTTLIQ